MKILELSLKQSLDHVFLDYVLFEMYQSNRKAQDFFPTHVELQSSIIVGSI